MTFENPATQTITYPDLTIEIIEQCKVPTCGFYNIMPDVAKQIIENRNPKNRNISVSKADQLQSDLKTGRFRLNGESVVFGNHGSLIDGQHRIHSVAHTGIGIITLVAMGIDPETMGSIDQGAGRTAGDVLGFDGFSNTSTLAAVARMLLAFEATGGTNVGNNTRFSRADVIDAVTVYPTLPESVAWGKALQHHLATSAYNVSAISFCHFLLGERYDLPMVEEYLKRIAIGDNISVGDPAFTARRRAERPDIHTNQQRIEIILRGWLSQIRDKSISVIPLSGELPNLPSARHMQAMRTRMEKGYTPSVVGLAASRKSGISG